MLLHPTCEPIDLPPGGIARVAYVISPAGAAPVSRFLHFHDVVEIVLFVRASGSIVCDGTQFAVRPGTIFYAPTMRYHDYVAEAGPADWILVQIDPYSVQKVAERLGRATPATGMCLTPDAETRRRLLMLARWLNDSLADDRKAGLAEHIVSLMLAVIWEIPNEGGIPIEGMTTDVERFTSVIERLRANPGDPLGLKDAATLCNLSSAYFSRRFADVFGCGFSDYVASYRLHLAARQVATTQIPLSAIGYALGFASPSHFSARYRERFGVTPRAYRSAMQLTRKEGLRK